MSESAIAWLASRLRDGVAIRPPPLRSGSRDCRPAHDPAPASRNVDVGEPPLALSESRAESDRDAISMRGSPSAMSRSSMRTETNSYTTYSIGCAGVWGVILLVGRRRLDAQTWNTLRLVCSGWWMGWTSATIARVGYPPPKQLTPAGEKRLRIISIVLVALGLGNAFRVLAAGKRPPASTS
jgi:hypothetical protein